MGLRCGVVVIGSLLWDTRKGRPAWRDENLVVDERLRVQLPIRYGRHAQTWDRAFTMCFSNECEGERRGRGWVLPLRREISTAEELLIEARALGRVEGFAQENDYMHSEWGMVSVLAREQSVRDSLIGERWAPNGAASTIAAIKGGAARGERPCVTDTGLLDVAWPELADGGRLEMDVLLAAATCPRADGGDYAPPEAIAAAMLTDATPNDGWKYFDGNRREAIETFQDADILRALGALQ